MFLKKPGSEYNNAEIPDESIFSLLHDKVKLTI